MLTNKGSSPKTGAEAKSDVLSLMFWLKYTLFCVHLDFSQNPGIQEHMKTHKNAWKYTIIPKHRKLTRTHKTHKTIWQRTIVKWQVKMRTEGQMN